MSCSNSRTISLDKVITVISNDGGFEEKTNTFEGEEIRSNELTQFPLQDHVPIYTYRNEHYLYKIDFSMFSCILGFDYMPMVPSTH